MAEAAHQIHFPIHDSSESNRFIKSADMGLAAVPGPILRPVLTLTRRQDEVAFSFSTTEATQPPAMPDHYEIAKHYDVRLSQPPGSQIHIVTAHTQRYTRIRPTALSAFKGWMAERGEGDGTDPQQWVYFGERIDGDHNVYDMAVRPGQSSFPAGEKYDLWTPFRRIVQACGFLLVADAALCAGDITNLFDEGNASRGEPFANPLNIEAKPAV